VTRDTKTLPVDGVGCITVDPVSIKAGLMMGVPVRRLSFTLACDRILVLFERCVVENGAPRALLGQGGVLRA
jgi:hypothetical protein